MGRVSSEGEEAEMEEICSLVEFLEVLSTYGYQNGF